MKTREELESMACEVLHNLIALPGDNVKPSIFYEMALRTGLIDALEKVQTDMLKYINQSQARSIEEK